MALIVPLKASVTVPPAGTTMPLLVAASAEVRGELLYTLLPPRNWILSASTKPRVRLLGSYMEAVSGALRGHRAHSGRLFYYAAKNDHITYIALRSSSFSPS